MGWPIAVDVHGLSLEADDDGVMRVGGVRVTGPSGSVVLRQLGPRIVGYVRAAGEARDGWLQLEAIEFGETRFESVGTFIAAGHGEMLTTVADALGREIRSRFPRSGVHRREGTELVSVEGVGAAGERRR